MRRLQRLIAALLGIAIIWNASPANAKPAASGDDAVIQCGYFEEYSVYSPKKVWISTNTASEWLTGPGTITFTDSGTITVGMTVSASFSVSMGAILAEAEATFGIDFTASSSWSTSWSYSIPVPSGVTSRLVRTKEGRQMSFTKTVYYTNCTIKDFVGSAIIPVASNSSAYYCWKRDDYPATSYWYANAQGGC